MLAGPWPFLSHYPLIPFFYFKNDANNKSLLLLGLISLGVLAELVGLSLCNMEKGVGDTPFVFLLSRKAIFSFHSTQEMSGKMSSGFMLKLKEVYGVRNHSFP